MPAISVLGLVVCNLVLQIINKILQNLIILRPYHPPPRHSCLLLVLPFVLSAWRAVILPLKATTKLTNFAFCAKSAENESLYVLLC